MTNMNASNEKAYAIGFRIYNVNELLKNYKFMIDYQLAEIIIID